MIRHAMKNDLEAIVRIYNEAIPIQATADTEAIEVDSRLKWFDEHNETKYPILVYEIDGRIVGWISLSTYRSGRNALRYTAEVSYYIDNNYKRQGIGSKLLHYVIQNCSDYQIKTLYAIVLEHNTPSIKLLEKFHFAQWGKLHNVADFNGKECSHIYYGLRVKD
jgi:L-amino acid N-acyltransferase YncA